MQLKKIILCGFKSFADQTEFEFGEGVTVVVGPNGCGKSNVVDAVRWVLGEQSAKSLRGGQMLDVIFNGSGSRKSMSYAEVTLVFGNTRGLLNLDAEEVSVSRKLFRSGESQYLLNNQSCRLKDIRELFLDTGVGADAYSIIEQGKVETLLQASKEDRRAIFEEAAGISRYQARQREAERRLERTEQNVLRLQDILGELDKRLRSVRYQAGKARSYQAHTARLKELRVNHFLAEYHEIQTAARQTEAECTRLHEALLAASAAWETLQAQLSVLDDELDGCDRQIRQADNELLQCTSQIGSQQDRIDLGHRRCEELEEGIGRGRQQLHALRAELAALETELQTDQQEMSRAETELAQHQEQLQGLQDARQQRSLALAELRAQLDDEKSGLIDIVRRAAQLHNEITSLDVRHTSLSGQRNRLHDRQGQVHAEMADLLAARAQAEEKRRRIGALLAESQGCLETTRQQVAKLNLERLGCSENLAGAKEYRSGLVSRQQLLADLEASLEGVDVGVRQVLQAKQQEQGAFYYLRGMVADLLEADVKYAALVEAALTGQTQRLVATHSQAVLEDGEAIEALRGRVQIICLDQLPPFRDGFDFSPYPEVKAKLIDLVNCPADCEKLALHLLGKTVLVDTIDAAVRLRQVAPRGYRWVSLAGEVLESDGTLHLGPQNASAGLISRKSELRQLEESLAEADERIRELQHQLEQYDHQSHHLEKNLQDLRTAIYETRTEEVETHGRLEQIDGNLERLKREAPLLSTEIESLEGQMQEALSLQATSRQSLSDLENVNRQRQEAIDRLEAQIGAWEREDAAVLDRITEIKVALGAVQQKRGALREGIAKVQTQLGQLQHHRRTAENDLAHAQQSLTDAQRAILAAEMKLAELFHARQQQDQTVRALRRRQEELHEQKTQLKQAAAEHAARRDRLQQELHEVQLRQNEARLRGENLAVRAQEELGVDLAGAFGGYQHQELDWSAVHAEIEELRQKIERLGNVNLDALAEQDDLEKRSAELTGQLTDLSEAQRQLEQLIAKINKESEVLFRRNFEAIRVHFTELFRKLFGGGRAEIILEDAENVLECGIEIVARPPGKQLQSLSLLSGGEKTMTAVALLLAIFKSKPSPFCLLDEVDAALDEANNERFNLVVQEFLQSSQFVIITHSRRTMTIADVIYGVTMQEQGVSKKVSVRFAGESADVPTDTAVA